MATFTLRPPHAFRSLKPWPGAATRRSWRQNRPLLRRPLPEHHQAVGLAVRQRREEGAVDDAEDGGGRGDAERQGDDGDGREAGIAPEQAEAEPCVAKEQRHDEPSGQLRCPAARRIIRHLRGRLSDGGTAVCAVEPGPPANSLRGHWIMVLHMCERASVARAKNQLSALIDRVRRGETVMIEDHGVPVAQLQPVRLGAGPIGACCAAGSRGRAPPRAVSVGGGSVAGLPATAQAGTSGVAALVAEREEAMMFWDASAVVPLLVEGQTHRHDAADVRRAASIRGVARAI